MQHQRYNYPGSTLVIIISFLFFLLPVGCSTSYKPDPKKTAANRIAVTLPDSLAQRQQQGIDFFAEGNLPVHWTLELDLEKGFSFKPGDGRLLFASPSKAINVAGNSSIEYETKTDEGLMKVTLYNEPCPGNEKVSKPMKKTEITLNNKRYMGCGNFLYDNSINDIWILESIGNKNPGVPAKVLPWMEFNLLENKMYGFNGCNDINSKIKIEGNRISFSAFSNTKKSCPGAETVQIFNTMLSDHIVDYSITGGRLTLVLINETKLVFTRKD